MGSKYAIRDSKGESEAALDVAIDETLSVERVQQVWLAGGAKEVREPTEAVLCLGDGLGRGNVNRVQRSG